LADPANYAAAANDGPTQMAFNGPPLSPTDGQAWHFIPTVWSDAYTLSFVQHFDTDSVYVAMRVPYTPSYNERYLRQLAANPLAKVVTVGLSAQNRPLYLVQIGSGGASTP